MKHNGFKEIVKMVTSAVMSSGPYEWPPSCLLFSYQPMRPNQEPAPCDHLITHKSEEKN